MVLESFIPHITAAFAAKRRCMIIKRSTHDCKITLRQFELSNTLRRLWIEHVLWTRFFM